MISANEIRETQTAWGLAVVEMGRIRDDRSMLEKYSGEVISLLYAFGSTEVLFKPTRAVDIPYRNSAEGALSYFIGGNPDFPEDTGFALNPWVNVKFRNSLYNMNGDRATVMGHYYFTDTEGMVLKVEYSLGYLKDESGALRIWLQHSSLPYSPAD